jgi:predicted transcriptional regulator
MFLPHYTSDIEHGGWTNLDEHKVKHSLGDIIFNDELIITSEIEAMTLEKPWKQKTSFSTKARVTLVEVVNYCLSTGKITDLEFESD